MDPSGFGDIGRANAIGVILLGFYLFCVILIVFAAWLAFCETKSKPKTDKRDTVFYFSTRIIHEFEYENHKRETRLRKFVPEKMYYGSNRWHPELQWLIEGTDYETSEERTFALNGFK